MMKNCTIITCIIGLRVTNCRANSLLHAINRDSILSNFVSHVIFTCHQRHSNTTAKICFHQIHGLIRRHLPLQMFMRIAQRASEVADLACCGSDTYLQSIVVVEGLAIAWAEASVGADQTFELFEERRGENAGRLADVPGSVAGTVRQQRGVRAHGHEIEGAANLLWRRGNAEEEGGVPDEGAVGARIRGEVDDGNAFVEVANGHELRGDSASVECAEACDFAAVAAGRLDESALLCIASGDSVGMRDEVVDLLLLPESQRGASRRGYVVQACALVEATVALEVVGVIQSEEAARHRRGNEGGDALSEVLLGGSLVFAEAARFLPERLALFSVGGLLFQEWRDLLMEGVRIDSAESFSFVDETDSRSDIGQFSSLEAIAMSEVRLHAKNGVADRASKSHFEIAGGGALQVQSKLRVRIVFFLTWLNLEAHGLASNRSS